MKYYHYDPHQISHPARAIRYRMLQQSALPPLLGEQAHPNSSISALNFWITDFTSLTINVLVAGSINALPREVKIELLVPPELLPESVMRRIFLNSSTFYIQLKTLRINGPKSSQIPLRAVNSALFACQHFSIEAQH